MTRAQQGSISTKADFTVGMSGRGTSGRGVAWEAERPVVSTRSLQIGPFISGQSCISCVWSSPGDHVFIVTWLPLHQVSGWHYQSPQHQLELLLATRYRWGNCSLENIFSSFALNGHRSMEPTEFSHLQYLCDTWDLSGSHCGRGVGWGCIN